MNEHILRLSEDICKAKTLGLVKPLHPGRLQLGRRDDVGIEVFEICKRRPFRSIRRLDLKDLCGLYASICLLHLDLDGGTVGHGALTEVPQHIRVQKDVRTALICDDKAEALHRIEPFHFTGDNTDAI